MKHLHIIAAKTPGGINSQPHRSLRATDGDGASSGEGEFTPGPWSILDDDDLKVTAPDGDDEPWHIAHICGACGHEDDASEANARLIAAAPELLEAVEALFSALEGYIPADEARAKARSALHKARAAQGGDQ
jgi:hypothetical protein